MSRRKFREVESRRQQQVRSCFGCVKTVKSTQHHGRTKKHNCIHDGYFKEIERWKRLELETKVEMAGGPGTGLSSCEEDRSLVHSCCDS